MDWGRAKMILIVSFFILNAVLGYQLWTTRSDLLEFDANTTSAAEEIQRLLKSKNIQIFSGAAQGSAPSEGDCGQIYRAGKFE